MTDQHSKIIGSSTSGSVDLPEPSQEEKNHSRQLVELIRHEIELTGGALCFDRFMDLALYTPGLGYYACGLQKFGAKGDFITAPEVSPLFSQALAKQVAQLLSALEDGVIIEFGAGSGVMAAEILAELERDNALPAQYLIIELSAELQARQRETLVERVPHLLARVSWLQRLPDTPLNGVVLANEVLDAMPVRRFLTLGHGLYELGVAWGEAQLAWKNVPANDSLNEAIALLEKERGEPFSAGYCSEYNPALPGWMAALSGLLKQGAALLIDYGYGRSEYYSPERNMGTLMCHYRHRAHGDPLWYPGIQDITAYVDFTAVADAGIQADFEVSGYTTQAQFLFGCGLHQLFERESADDIVDQLRIAQQVKTLTLPSEMGERFKVMALSKNMDLPLIGFRLRDFRERL